MYKKLKCPSCGMVLEVDSTQKRAYCPNCRDFIDFATSFTVEQEGKSNTQPYFNNTVDSGSATATKVVNMSIEDILSTNVEEIARKGKRKHTKRIIVSLIVIFCVIVLAVGGYLYKNTCVLGHKIAVWECTHYDDNYHYLEGTCAKCRMLIEKQEAHDSSEWIQSSVSETCYYGTCDDCGCCLGKNGKVIYEAVKLDSLGSGHVYGQSGIDVLLSKKEEYSCIYLYPDPLNNQIILSGNLKAYKIIASNINMLIESYASIDSESIELNDASTIITKGKINSKSLRIEESSVLTNNGLISWEYYIKVGSESSLCGDGLYHYAGSRVEPIQDYEGGVVSGNAVNYLIENYKR